MRKKCWVHAFLSVCTHAMCVCYIAYCMVNIPYWAKRWGRMVIQSTCYPTWYWVNTICSHKIYLYNTPQDLTPRLEQSDWILPLFTQLHHARCQCVCVSEWVCMCFWQYNMHTLGLLKIESVILSIILYFFISAVSLSVHLISPTFSACSRIESNQSIQVSWADQWYGKKLTFCLNVCVCVCV